jgi:hypothetical protein
MAQVFKFLVTLLMVQLFFSFSITLIAYSLAPFNIPTLSLVFQNFEAQTQNQTALANQINSANTSTLHLPLIDLGALVFFTGNIIVDLLINFITAIPGLVNLLVDALTMLVPLPANLAVQIKLTVYVVATITYLIMLMEFVMTVRSRGATIQ